MEPACYNVQATQTLDNFTKQETDFPRAVPLPLPLDKHKSLKPGDGWSAKNTLKIFSQDRKI